jgi:hypothetical protein
VGTEGLKEVGLRNGWYNTLALLPIGNTDG